MTDARATLQGFVAIALWSSLATLTAVAGPIPPFQLAAMTFAIGALTGLIHAHLGSEHLPPLAAVPAPALLLGVGGLLGYHVAYFFALQTAPPLEANLVNYLWPLLIVLFSGMLPARVGGRPLRWWHVAGAITGLAGTALALIDPSRPLYLVGNELGFSAALLAAVIWAAYSVASRLFAGVPSSALVVCCAATSGAALLLHLALETTRWPPSLSGWATVAAMGAGPVGLAFFYWDRAMKHGDMRLVGVAAYATPLLSTALLAASGLGAVTPHLWLAAVLVTTGALICALPDRSADRR